MRTVIPGSNQPGTAFPAIPRSIERDSCSDSGVPLAPDRVSVASFSGRGPCPFGCGSLSPWEGGMQAITFFLDNPLAEHCHAFRPPGRFKLLRIRRDLSCQPSMRGGFPIPSDLNFVSASAG